MPAPQRVARTICGFANARGGKLIVGMSDKGEKIGIIDPEAEKKRLTEAAQAYCSPAIELQFELQCDGKSILLVAHIPEGKQKPYKALHTNSNWYAYIRAGTETLRASRMVEKSLPKETPLTIEDNSAARPLDSKEIGLIEYLRLHQRITAKGFQQLMNLSPRRARRILVLLTLEGIIRQHDHNKEDYYTL